MEWGRGLGFTINVPLEAGLGDDQYKRAIRDKLLPAAREFRPDLVLVSAGFDAYKHDVLGRMKVTPRGFGELTRMVKAVAREHCQDRLVAGAGGRLQPRRACRLRRAHSYRKAPELCLARFDELKGLGLEKFTRKYDPYWDIPLNENLPKPVIDLPIPKDEMAEQTDDGRWKERSGQISFLSPGPLFDQKSDGPPKRTRKKK